jgi:hypothetical protein
MICAAGGSDSCIKPPEPERAAIRCECGRQTIIRVSRHGRCFENRVHPGGQIAGIELKLLSVPAGIARRPPSGARLVNGNSVIAAFPFTSVFPKESEFHTDIVR